jgi:hypothetical protein
MNEQEELNGRLISAARWGNLTALEQALADGAQTRRGDSWALREAALGGHADCVKLLIPVSDPKAHESYALRWAAHEGHADCVALLLPASDPLAVGIDGLDAAGSARQGGQARVVGMIEAFIEAQALSSAANNPKSSPRVKWGL